MKKTEPYGTWVSPITAEKMAEKNIGFSFPTFYGDALYWMESRPHEQGRTVIACKKPSGEINTLTPDGHSVRSKAQEYGGKCYCFGGDDLFFVNAADQCIYKQSLVKGGPALPVTAQNTKAFEDGEYRYADLIYDAKNQHIIAVGEYHQPDLAEPLTQILSVSIATGVIDVLAQGADFYAHPRLSSDGNRLLWLQWYHPNMPWDSTALWVADLEQNKLINTTSKIARDDESIFQPEWSETGDLYYISDRSGWWNLYRLDGDDGHMTEPEPVFPVERDCGLPLWQYGMSTWGFIEQNTLTGKAQILIASCEGAQWQLHILSRESGAVSEVNTSHYSSLGDICTDENGNAAVVAAGPTTPSELCVLSTSGGASTMPSSKLPSLAPLLSSSTSVVDEKDVSVAVAFEFSTTDNDKAYAYYYAPKNARYEGNENSQPPLIVLCHGGPTASTTSAVSLKVQFWTTRGFAVVDVNYRGSTGYGRKYRDKLKDKWGVYDVDDACAAAQQAAENGWGDKQRLIIRGSSAGGYTVLSALCFKSVFAAGASLYGIGDLNTLVSDTHKFESQYTVSLIAPLADKATYFDRSPLFHIDGFNCPVIFLQGLKDKVVPPNQAETMLEALDSKGIPVAYVTYENEGHGFRSSENIIHAFNSELEFYGRVFGFDTDSNADDLTIRNLS